MLLEKELFDFSSDMYLDLIIKFNNDIEFDETNRFTEEEDLSTLSVVHLMNRLEKSLSVSLDKVGKMLNKNLEASDLIRLCHIGIEIANAKCGSNKRRRSAGSDESSPNKRKSKETTVKTPIQSSIPTDLERKISEMEYSSHTGPPAEIDDNKKRWLVVGICLHSILSPALRKYVEPVVTSLYNSLKLSDQIDKQTYTGRLEIYGAVNIKLNYKTINNNKTTGNRKPHYDYKVQNAVDLSKLFLETNMAHYKGFDESCDSSALLGIIVNIDKFPVNVQIAARDVRSEIRNRWAHCDFTEWNSGMYNWSLQKIEDFIYLLHLNAPEESQTIGELNKWKTNGTSYLKDTTLGLELVNDIRQQIKLLVEYEKVICKSADIEFSTVHTELTEIGKTLSQHDKRISSLENKFAKQETTLLKYGSLYDAEPVINSWRQKMELFVKTDVVTDILQILKESHCALLTGVSGMGKTLTAQNIALHLWHEKKYSIVPCSCLSDIQKLYRENLYQVFFVDDMCGKYTANIQKIDNWINIEDFVKSILVKGKTKILATSRTEVYLEEKFQVTFDLFNKNAYNLSNKYSFKDKLVIAGKYLKQDDQMLLATKPNVEFTPLMCFLYAQHEYFDLNDFLNSPYETFCKEWNKLKSFDKEKLCALFLCVLYNGTIDEAIVGSTELNKDENRKLKDIFDCCNLNRHTHRSTIKDKLNACIDTYFTKVDREYKVIHDKMFDFLCCYFGKTLTTPILKLGDDKLIYERVQLESIQKPHGEFAIVISSNDEPKYKERVRRDLEHGKIHWCLNNVQMKYKEYREMFSDVLKDLDYDSGRRLINIKDDSGILNSFIVSCLRGYEELVDFFLSVGANADAKNGWFTPLTAACRDGHLKTVEILLDKGSTINGTNTDGETALYTACFGGHYALVKCLIKRRADINKRNNNNRSPLYVSCLSGHNDIVRLLIEKGANVSECSDSLIGATCGGSHKIVETLLTKDVDVNIVDMQGRTALLIACEEGYYDIATLLIDKKADICKVDSTDSSPLHAACYAGNNDIVKTLINSSADMNRIDVHGETPLHKACRKGYVNVIQTLLAEGADINKASVYGYTPADVAKTEGNIGDVGMLKSLENEKIRHLERINNSESLKEKFQKQTDQATSNLGLYGRTQLYFACERGDIKTVQSLIKNGANVNMKSNNGELPLVAACQQGHNILIQILLDQGADINEALLSAVHSDYDKVVNILLCKRGIFRDDEEKSLMTLACEQGSIKSIKILLEKGADINDVDNNKHIPICIACFKGFDHIVELLIKRGSKLNCHCKDDKTPLYSACELGFQKIAEMLIANGADVKEIYANRKSLQHIPCNNALFKLLTNKGLEPNIPDKDGRYLLYMSIDKRFYVISEHLVQKNSPIAVSEDDIKTALISVFESGKNELSRLLVSKGYTNNLKNFNDTMLYHACRLGLSEKVRKLHDYGTDLQIQYKFGYTPVILADIAGNDDLLVYLSQPCNYFRFSVKSDDIVHIRMRKNNKYINSEINEKYEHLFQACMTGQTKQLINEKMLSKLNINIFFKPKEPNCAICFTQTPLCIASRRGHKDVIELLLKYGANVNLTFEEKHLKENQSLSMTILYGYTPLFAAIQRKFDQITIMLLENDAYLNKALYDACREGYFDAVQFLLQKGAAVNSFGRFGQTALYAACIGGYHAIVELLIEQGAIIDTKVKPINIIDEITCLHAAYQCGNYHIVKLLINRGASVDIVGNFGRTLLHKACIEGNYKIVEILFNKGVDINAPDMYGTTPLMSCLLQSKRNYNYKQYVDNKIIIKHLFSLEEDDFYELHAYNVNRRNILFWRYNRLSENHYNVIQLLIENGADNDKADEKGRTPLSFAWMIGDMKLYQILLHKECLMIQDDTV